MEFQYECTPTEQLEIFLCSIRKVPSSPPYLYHAQAKPKCQVFSFSFSYFVGFVLNKKEEGDIKIYIMLSTESFVDLMPKLGELTEFEIHFIFPILVGKTSALTSSFKSILN